jgi:hypothetical protein
LSRRPAQHPLSARFAAAAGRDGAWWVQAGCLALAGTIAWGLVRVVPGPKGSSEEALRLGIISATTVAGYAKERDAFAFALALSVGLVASLALWAIWCARAGGGPAASVDPEPSAWRWRELVVLTAVLAIGLLRFDLAVNGWDAPYTFYAEEGEALAWARVVLDGGVLSRDVYCLYGPLATYPIVGAFLLFEPSVWLWRVVIYLLDLPALLAVYLLLRETCKTRTAAALGVALVLFHRMWPMPAMSWSLLRTAIGIGAIAALAGYVRTARPMLLAAAGALVGVGLMFSQEAGIAAAFAVALGTILETRRRRMGVSATARAVLALAAGATAVLLPLAAWAAAQGALAARIDNLVGFSRLRWIGHGAQPFPGLAPETLSLYVAPAVYVLIAFLSGVRALAGSWTGADAIRLALAAYGLLLFASPLSRPDLTHLLFAMIPAFVLLVMLAERAVDVLLSRDRGWARRTAATAFLAAVAIGLGSFDVDTRENVGLFARQAWLNATARGAGVGDADARELHAARGGGVRLPAREAEDLDAVVALLREETAPGEAVWAFPNEPMVNFLADRPLAGRYPLALFAVTRDQREDLVSRVDESNVRLAVVNRKPAAVDGIPSRDAVPEAWDYLETHFVPERELGRFVVMRRRAAP